MNFLPSRKAMNYKLIFYCLYVIFFPVHVLQDFEKQSVDWSYSLYIVSDSKLESAVSYSFPVNCLQ